MLLAWGDVDALAEAGFCYAQGIGCRKNLKKAAGFYRQAEAKGMSMVGNSWYVGMTVTSLRCHVANN
jgi:TPR repeat protein